MNNLSSSQLTELREMAALGIRPSVLAAHFEVTRESVLETCVTEIERAALDTHRAVFKSLHQMAISGKSSAAAIFWIKNLCAHLLPGHRKQPASSFDFEVYCNDGEPNYDY